MKIDEVMKKIEESGKFNYSQKEQISFGLQKGLDISIYSKPEFDEDQMCEIRFGLEKGLDVNYIKPEFDWRQTPQISTDLREDLYLKEWMEYYAKEWKFWNRVVRILSKKDCYSKDYREVTKQAILKRKIIEEDYNFYAIRVKAADDKALIKE